MYLDEVATLTRIGNIDDKVVITVFKVALLASYANLLSIKAVCACTSGLLLPLVYIYIYVSFYIYILKIINKLYCLPRPKLLLMVQ